jgi:hypothetical protein
MEEQPILMHSRSFFIVQGDRLDPRLSDFLRQFDPPPGTRLWYGGASLFGTLRGVSAQQAAWRAEGHDHSIWQLVLHCAYSRYNVRRSFAGIQERGGFPRQGAYWAVLPEVISEKTWKEDMTLLKKEHQLLVEAVKTFDPVRLDEQASPASRYVDLLWGIVMHDLYHVGEMQVLKRLFLLQKER